MDLLYMGPRCEAKRIFFSFVFANLFEYFDESMLLATAGIQNERCSLLRLLSFPAVVYSAYLWYNFPVNIRSVGYCGDSKLAL
jgi:hypothetical protein